MKWDYLCKKENLILRSVRFKKKPLKSSTNVNDNVCPLITFHSSVLIVSGERNVRRQVEK